MKYIPLKLGCASKCVYDTAVDHDCYLVRMGSSEHVKNLGIVTENLFVNRMYGGLSETGETICYHSRR